MAGSDGSHGSRDLRCRGHHQQDNRRIRIQGLQPDCVGHQHRLWHSPADWSPGLCHLCQGGRRRHHRRLWWVSYAHAFTIYNRLRYLKLTLKVCFHSVLRLKIKIQNVSQFVSRSSSWILHIYKIIEKTINICWSVNLYWNFYFYTSTIGVYFSRNVGLRYLSCIIL